LVKIYSKWTIISFANFPLITWRIQKDKLFLLQDLIMNIII